MANQSEKETRFMELIERYRHLIYKVCYMYAADGEHLKDLYQEVMANLWQGLDGFRSEAQPSTWIYRVTLNTCVSSYRKNRRMGDTIPLDLAADLEADTDDRVTNLREMYRMISRLDKMDKAIIMLWLDEQSYDEIASVTGLTRSNVATRLHRIRQRLVRDNNE